MSKDKPKPKPGAKFDPRAGVDDRARYLQPRDKDRYCRIHKAELDATGYCAAAKAWWFPRFACPHCAGQLWDNGFCETCTPKRQEFTGDYFEQRWVDGPDWGHFVRVHRGPTPVNQERTAAYLNELKAVIRTVSNSADANGLGVSRRLLGCRCPECLAHFGLTESEFDASRR